MRPSVRIVLAAAVVWVGAAAAQEGDRVYPSVRGDPPLGSSGRDGPAIAPLEQQVPTPPTRPTAPDRAPLRGPSGEAEGFSDQPRTGRRGIARDSEGAAFGTIEPNRLGGGTVRDSDGTRRGMIPSPPPRQRYEPR